jgi:hypothetical protein
MSPPSVVDLLAEEVGVVLEAELESACISAESLASKLISDGEK